MTDLFRSCFQNDLLIRNIILSHTPHWDTGPQWGNNILNFFHLQNNILDHLELKNDLENALIKNGLIDQHWYSRSHQIEY